MVKVIKYDETYLNALISALVGELSPEKIDELKSVFKSITPNGNVTALICLNENGDPVGYMLGEILPRGEEKITDIFVKQNLRRQGIGSVILVSEFYYATKRLGLRVNADCEKSNETAVAFFSARTFSKADETADRIFFTKSLLPMYKGENR